MLSQMYATKHQLKKANYCGTEAPFFIGVFIMENCWHKYFT